MSLRQQFIQLLREQPPETQLFGVKSDGQGNYCAVGLYEKFIAEQIDPFHIFPVTAILHMTALNDAGYSFAYIADFLQAHWGLTSNLCDTIVPTPEAPTPPCDGSSSVNIS